MLAADKQMLDAELQQQLQEMRTLEINNLLTRFTNAIAAATLIGGFSFSGIVDLGDVDHSAALEVRICTALFYVLACIALALSLFVMAVSSMSLVLGNGLMISANVNQASHHDENVAEFRKRFMQVLLALCGAALAISAASIFVVWVRQSVEAAIVASSVFVIAVPLTAYVLYAMKDKIVGAAELQTSSGLTLHAEGQTIQVGKVLMVGDLDKPSAATLHPSHPGAKLRDAAHAPMRRYASRANFRVGTPGEGGPSGTTGPSESTVLLPGRQGSDALTNRGAWAV